ncbi:MAG: nucleotidyltransferase domain-containing protein [Candidatus Bathyarchaeia archaeon]
MSNLEEGLRWLADFKIPQLLSQRTSIQILYGGNSPKMLKLRRVNIERSEEVFEKIKAYVKAVVSHLNPQLVILFGSFATGDINEGSDVDILVVADFKEDFPERIGTLMKLNTFWHTSRAFGLHARGV